MSLVTAAQVKVYLPGLAAAGTDEDTALATLITRAEAAIARYCGYPPASDGATPTMASTSYTLYVRARVPESSPSWGDGPEGYRTLRLPVRPVTAVASVYSDIDESYPASTLVASTDYTRDGNTGELRLKTTAVLGSWSPEKRAQKVACTAGFVTAPDDLIHAICLLAATYHKRRPDTGVERQATGDKSSREMEKGLPKEVRELLDEGGFVLPGKWWGE